MCYPENIEWKLKKNLFKNIMKAEAIEIKIYQ